MSDRQKTAVLVPIKPFAQAKMGLHGACTRAQRELLARGLARNVLNAANGLRTHIIGPSDANDVRRFALINGARFFAEPANSGLDGAVSHGVEQLHERCDRIIVIMGDLPLVQDIRWLADHDGITVVSDRTGEGTNAISLPSKLEFSFSFGAGSFQLHQKEAERLGLAVRAVADPDGVSADVSTIDDAIRHGVFLDGPITAEHAVINLTEPYGSENAAEAYDQRRRAATDQ